ncbi:MAG: HAD-IB family hydrolase [Chitinophagaceae bacterium]
MKKRIAFFDFDGTITTKDTLLEIIKFYKGSSAFYIGFILNAPFIVAWKAGLITNQAAKERMLTWFFKKKPLASFQESCNEFARTQIPALIRPKALQEIKKLQELGAEVVIVSASAENWLQEWCTEHGVQLIGTKLQIKNNLLTGKIEGFNCHGKEKANRIKAVFDLNSYHEIYCYGDTKGDKPMLALATSSFYKPFR